MAKELGLDPVAVLEETSRLRQAVRVAAAMALSDARAASRSRQQQEMAAKQRNGRG